MLINMKIVIMAIQKTNIVRKTNPNSFNSSFEHLHHLNEFTQSTLKIQLRFWPIKTDL